jgi:hypothetical protein
LPPLFRHGYFSSFLLSLRFLRSDDTLRRRLPLHFIFADAMPLPR